MVHLLGFSKSANLPLNRGGFFVYTVLALLLTVTVTCASPDQKQSNQNKTSPSVVVLVLSGLGPYDQISIQYTSIVPLKKASADLMVLRGETGWSILSSKIATRSSATPGSTPTTSISFQTPRIIDTGRGLLPLAPFITAFKQHPTIDINYLVTFPLQFRGLKDFENDYVKIVMKRSGNSYLYKVRVKDSSFEHLSLPVTTVGKQQAPKKAMPVGARMLLVVGLAVLGAVAVYYAAGFLFNRKRSSG